MLSIIVAISENNAIGKNGDLLCHMSADLKHFKEITTGHPIIMGKRTYESLPKRPLPNRRNIVLTREQGKTFEGAEVVNSAIEAQAAVENTEEAFVIGGGMVYEQFLPLADKLYVTHIHHVFDDADTFFPAIDTAVWQQTKVEQFDADEKNPYPYSFVEYIRK